MTYVFLGRSYQLSRKLLRYRTSDSKPNLQTCPLLCFDPTERLAKGIDFLDANQKPTTLEIPLNHRNNEKRDDIKQDDHPIPLLSPNIEFRDVLVWTARGLAHSEEEEKVLQHNCSSAGGQGVTMRGQKGSACDCEMKRNQQQRQQYRRSVEERFQDEGHTHIPRQQNLLCQT